eukprot:3848431-Alexandrium_andersonii.AAC.1
MKGRRSKRQCDTLAHECCGGETPSGHQAVVSSLVRTLMHTGTIAGLHSAHPMPRCALAEVLGMQATATQTLKQL